MQLWWVWERLRPEGCTRRAEGKGFVEFIHGSPTYYRAVEPDQVMERLRDELVEAIDRSTSELKSLSMEAHGCSPVWCIRSEWGIKNRIKDFLSKVEEELAIFCKSPDLLREHRADLKKKGREIPEGHHRRGSQLQHRLPDDR